jgi:hypothetical protein
VGLILVMVGGCGGSANPLHGPDATPHARRAAATTVDVCRLVSSRTAATVLDRPLLVIGRTVGAPRDPTVSCVIGPRFDEPVVTVSLAPVPVALDVFDEAYGEQAGGNPLPVRHLGRAAYIRTEGAQRALHVFVHQAILSVLVALAPTGSPDRITTQQLVDLTRNAVRNIPANPHIAAHTAPDRCVRISPAVLAETLGRAPTLDAGLVYSSGSLQCSWGSQPGSVTVTATDDPATIQRFRGDHDLAEYVAVPGVLARSEGRAYSSPQVPGDLIVLVGADELLITMEVVPAAGYADAAIDTTKSERTLAAAVLADLT